MKKWIDFETPKNKWMEDAEFGKEYEALEEDFMDHRERKRSDPEKQSKFNKDFLVE